MKKKIKMNIKKFMKNYFILWCIITSIIDVAIIDSIYYLITGTFADDKTGLSITIILIIVVSIIFSIIEVHIEADK
jgi:hypothetical protein